MPGNDQVTRQGLLLQKLKTACGAALEELTSSLPNDLMCHPLETCHPPACHQNRSAQSYSVDVFVNRKETSKPDRSFSDYEVKIDENGLSGVKLIRKVG
jgi:hypothetical protein